MVFDFSFAVRVRELETGKWEVAMDAAPVRAYGPNREDAYGRFLAVYELYREYGEDWMAAVLAEKSEAFADAHTEMNGNPWIPDEAI